MYKNLLTPWKLTISFLAIGFFLSCLRFMDDPNWFSRSGAIVVIIGIFVALQNIEHIKLVNWSMELAKGIGDIKIDQNHKDQEINKVYKDKHHHRTDIIKDQLKESSSIKYGKKEAYILILGTFICGFGDLIVKMVC